MPKDDKQQFNRQISLSVLALNLFIMAIYPGFFVI